MGSSNTVPDVGGRDISPPSAPIDISAATGRRVAWSRAEQERRELELEAIANRAVESGEPGPLDPVADRSARNLAILRHMKGYGTHRPAGEWAEALAKAGYGILPVSLEPEGTGNPKDAIGDTKPQLHLVPSALVVYASLAMKNGADKYGPYNWREKKVRATVYISAVLRHLYQYLDGEDEAQDSGVNHLGHAVAGLGILLDALATGNLIDDRPTPGAAPRLIAEHTEQAA